MSLVEVVVYQQTGEQNERVGDDCREFSSKDGHVKCRVGDKAIECSKERCAISRSIRILMFPVEADYRVDRTIAWMFYKL